MNRIKRLLEAYTSFISVPWRDDISATERVIFCIYNAEDELILQTNIDEFEIVTRREKHEWVIFDLTDTFAEWLTGLRYAVSYFQNPDALKSYDKYLDFIKIKFESFVTEKKVWENSIVSLTGVGSLFGFLKIKELVDQIAANVPGRLLVFFPGSYENNNYRLFDAYDGWNYHAIPITSSKVF